MLLHASLLFTLLALSKAADSMVNKLICGLKASTRQLDSMTLQLYHDSIDRYTEVPIGEATDLMNKIDKSKETVVFVPHYLESLDLGQKTVIIDAYLSTNSYNVIQLHWIAISDNPLYNFAVCSVPDVGRYLGKALSSLVQSGLSQTTLSIVGHSLGAQVVGATGRSTNFTVEKLIGLDPAGPGFYRLVQYLSSSDGRSVVIIHSDRGGLGIYSESGHVDFHLNSGFSPQPGCLTLNLCSHIRAMSYWAEAVRNQKAFLARKCGSWDDFKAGSCSSNEVIEMSPDTPTNASGSYFLHTGSRSPFGLGEVGADG